MSDQSQGSTANEQVPAVVSVSTVGLTKSSSVANPSAEVPSGASSVDEMAK